MSTFALPSITYVDLALVLIFVYVVACTTLRKGSSLSLPPGPRRVPFLGNLLSMPMAKEWETFAKWGEKYVFSQTIVVLNSAKVAAELLDSRSAIYSDRPVVPMGGDLVGYNRALGLLPYGDRFKKHRRLAKQLFGNTKTMEAFYPIEEEEAHRLLKRLVSQSDRFVNHIQKMAGAIILRVTHGYPVQEGEDPFVKLADEALQQFSASSSPTSFMVNMVPALMYVPAWVPGVSFRKTARKWAAHLEETVEKPFEWVKTRMANGTAEMSFISNLLGEGQLNEKEEYDIKWTASALYAGKAIRILSIYLQDAEYCLQRGVDTTVGSQVSFLKAMLLWPEVAKKAQAELDTVVGSDRLPTFADRASLPYLNALALETFRWHSVGPTGIAHRLMEDDTYNGYFIPKGLKSFSYSRWINITASYLQDP
ncbi:hypothetical protein VKT23_013846 [Stygiomarasmius scandens]|uniref:Cytochrome P450 n=1 Tax=Marasmiellus scandens TaxID=2682957 RepID=A0ABR1J4H4_9AGAR